MLHSSRKPTQRTQGPICIGSAALRKFGPDNITLWQLAMAEKAGLWVDQDRHDMDKKARVPAIITQLYDH